MPKTVQNQNKSSKPEDVVAAINCSSGQTEAMSNGWSHTFTEHIKRTDSRMFTVDGKSSSPVKMVGMEVKPDDGYEYLLAVVGRSSGQIMELRPVSLVDFQPMYNPPEALILGEKRRQNADYVQDFGLAQDEYFGKKRSVLEDFGSTKINKKVSASMRRRVTDDTLNTMSTTAFSSSSVKEESVVKKEQIDAEGTPNLSILQKAESSVLPLPNSKAANASGLYSLEQFLPTTSASQVGLVEEAVAFFREFDTAEKLAKQGVPRVVINRIGNVSNRVKKEGQEIYSAAALKTIVLARASAELLAGRAPFIFPLNKLDTMNLPPQMASHVRGEYFGEVRTVARIAKFQMGPQQANRIYAHLLCLLLIIGAPDLTIPISPINIELKVAEKTAVKLLQGMGCSVMSATPNQATEMNTLRIARLTGLPEKTSLRKFIFTRK